MGRHCRMRRCARTVENLECFTDSCVKQPRACASEGVVRHLLENRVRKIVARAAGGVRLLENSLGGKLVEHRHEWTLAHR